MNIISLQYIDHPIYFILWYDPYPSNFWNMSPEPAVSVLPGNLLEMQISWPALRPDKQKSLRMEPSICVLISPWGDSDAG